MSILSRLVKRSSALWLEQRPMVLAVMAAILAGILMGRIWISPLIRENSGLKTKIAAARLLTEKYAAKLKGPHAAGKDAEGMLNRVELLESCQGFGSSDFASRLDSMFTPLSAKGLDKRSFRPLPTRNGFSYKELMFKYEFQCDIKGLYSLLQVLARSDLPIAIRELSIRSRAASGQNQLTVDLVLGVFAGAVAK